MNTEPNTTTSSTTDDQNLSLEIQEILRFIFFKGIKLPESISIQTIQNKDMENNNQIVSDYNALVTSILPSTPESIQFIGKEFMGDYSLVKSWKIPAVQKYILISLGALLGLVALSLFPDVSDANQEKGILFLSGLPLLENLFVIFFASLLGVMFYILKTIKDKIDNFTLTKVDIFSFNISIMIGVVAGFIISELFTFTTTILGSSIEIHKMTLALLGGFASDAIFTILQNAINKIKSLFEAP